MEYGCLTSVASGTLLNHFFTQSVWKRLLQHRADRLYDAVLSNYVLPYLDGIGAKTNRQLIDELERFMRLNFRNEYYFRNVLLRHFCALYGGSLERSVALTQQRIAESRADFIFLNGKAVVYEIKTDRDNLLRLETQIRNYYKAFQHVCIVCGNVLLKDLKNYVKDLPVGLLLLTDDGRIRVIKKPQQYVSALDANVMFNILRRGEFDFVLNASYGRLPKVASTCYYSQARKWFSAIPMPRLYPLFVRALKCREHCDWAVSADIPSALSALSYFWKDDGGLYAAMNGFLDAPYRKARRFVARKEQKYESEVLPIF